MPTYEYECQACGYRFELFQKITDAPVKKCPKCGKEKAKRLISAGAGLIFKGSGFYITDYKKRGKGEGKSAPKRKMAGTKSECGSSAAQEAKND